MERLKEIASKKALTKADKDYIMAKSVELGLQFEPKGRCGNCYKDQAVILYRALAKDDSRKWLLWPSVDVIWQGDRVNNTRTDDELQRYAESGLPLSLFEVINGVRK